MPAKLCGHSFFTCLLSVRSLILLAAAILSQYLLLLNGQCIDIGNFLLDTDWPSFDQFGLLISKLPNFLGNGLGRATNGSSIFGETALIDRYYAKILYEIGLLGLLAFLVVIATLIYLTFKAYRSIENRKLRCLPVCLWGFVLFISLNPIYYPLDVDPVAVYYWFFAGVLLKLPQLDSHR